MGFFSSLGGIASIAGAVTGQPWLTALGSAASAYGNNQSQQNAYQQNYELARAQLYNRHQIEVEDLKKSGLNPILSANSGASTFSPGGVGSLSNPSAEASSARQASMQAKLIQSENENTRAQIQKTLAEVRNIDADTELKGSQTDLNTYQRAILMPLQADNIEAMTKQARAQTDLWQAQTQVAEATIRKVEQDIKNSIAITGATVAKLGAEAEAATASAGYYSAGAALSAAQRDRLQSMTPYEIDKLAQEIATSKASQANLNAEERETLAQAYRVELVNERMEIGQEWAKNVSYAGEALRTLNPFGSR